jgi:hypothetical protein
MKLIWHIRIAGALQLLLALAHFVFIRRLTWREDLKGVPLFTRQVFWVHMGFIMLVVGEFGVLSLACAKSLLIPSPLAKAVLGGLTIFWVARWFCQFFIYDSELWRGNRLHTRVHIFFGLLWTYLATVYAIALARQFATAS